jgi:hypothetical protein
MKISEGSDELSQQRSHIEPPYAGRQKCPDGSIEWNAGITSSKCCHAKKTCRLVEHVGEGELLRATRTGFAHNVHE